MEIPVPDRTNYILNQTIVCGIQHAFGDKVPIQFIVYDSALSSAFREKGEEYSTIPLHSSGSQIKLPLDYGLKPDKEERVEDITEREEQIEKWKKAGLDDEYIADFPRLAQQYRDELPLMFQEQVNERELTVEKNPREYYELKNAIMNQPFITFYAAPPTLYPPKKIDWIKESPMYSYSMILPPINQSDSERQGLVELVSKKACLPLAPLVIKMRSRIHFDYIFLSEGETIKVVLFFGHNRKKPPRK